MGQTVLTVVGRGIRSRIREGTGGEVPTTVVKDGGLPLVLYGERVATFSHGADPVKSATPDVLAAGLVDELFDDRDRDAAAVVRPLVARPMIRPSSCSCLPGTTPTTRSTSWGCVHGIPELIEIPCETETNGVPTGAEAEFDAHGKAFLRPHEDLGVGVDEATFRRAVETVSVILSEPHETQIEGFHA